MFTQTTEFVYNGLGARLAVSVAGYGTTRYTLDYAANSRILAETTPTETVSYLYGHDCLGEQRDAEWLYYLHDAEGYVRQGADAEGEVISAWLFDPDGTVLEGPNGPVSHLICGGVYDWSTGLIYRGGRYFDPNLGIWLALMPLMVVQGWRKRKERRQWVLLLCVGLFVVGSLAGCCTNQPIPTPTPTRTPPCTDDGSSGPGTGTPGPGTGTPGPGTGTPGSGTGTPDPGTGTPGPGTGTPGPGTGTSDPGTGTPGPGTGTPSPHRYDREAAANYALKYNTTPNGVYYEFPKDCTNFVSQALFAGGIRSNPEKQWNREEMLITEDRPYYDGGSSIAWIDAGSLRTFLLTIPGVEEVVSMAQIEYVNPSVDANSKAHAQNNKTIFEGRNIQKGDVVLYDQEGYWGHAAFVVGWGSQTYYPTNETDPNLQKPLVVEHSTSWVGIGYQPRSVDNTIGVVLRISILHIPDVLP